MSQVHARTLTARQEHAPRVVPVPPQRPKKKKVDPIVWVTVGALFVLAACFVHVGQRAQLATLSYELHREQLRLVRAERLNNHLLVEVEKARSLGDIEAEARHRLGLVDPAATTWLTVGAEPRAAGDEQLSERPGNRLIAAISHWFHRVRAELIEVL